MEINELVKRSHEIAKEKGFWDTSYRINMNKNLLDDIKCTKCNKVLSRDNYYKSYLESFKYTCKDCDRDYKSKHWKDTYVPKPKVKLDKHGNIICRKCNIAKPKSEFHKSNSRIKGKYPKYKIGYNNMCKICRNEISRLYYNDNKLQALKRCYKRRKEINTISLWDNPYPKDVEIEWHHINNLFVIPIPKDIHRLNFINNRDVHRKIVNNYVRDLYYIDIEGILNGFE